jgi:putative ATP-binding cassette transporter
MNGRFLAQRAAAFPPANAGAGTCPELIGRGGSGPPWPPQPPNWAGHWSERSAFMPLLPFLRRQLQQLQRLAQPYFLPLELGGWAFGLLILALLAISSSAALLLVTGLVKGLLLLGPVAAAPFLQGSNQRLDVLWGQPLLPPWLLSALALAGLLIGALRPASRPYRVAIGLAAAPLALGLLVGLLPIGLLPAELGLASFQRLARSFWLSPLCPAGPALMLLAACGGVCFWSWRRHLRQGRWLPWLLLGLVMLLILFINGINVGISYIARDVDNALVAFHQPQFWMSVLIYAACLVLALPIRGIQSYLVPRFGLLWRRWLSDQLLTRYLNDRVYYRLSSDSEATAPIDNPDQRISEDAASFSQFSLNMMVDVCTAVLTFLSFIVVLSTISSRLALWLLVYAALGTALVLIASRRLVVLNGRQLRLNADFRYGLLHIRNHAEAIAFYRGEAQECREGMRRLRLAIRNEDRLIIWEALISVIQTSYDYFSDFLPWLVLAPLYFARQVDFGVLGQAGIAFSQVLSSISYIVANIDRLAAFSASIQRLETFQSTVAAQGLSDPACVPSALGSAAPPHSAADAIVLRHVDLVPPGGSRALVRDLSLTVGPRQRLLVVGPSGCGKTSFLRLVSGLWSAAKGDVERPEPGELLFIPQKPYMLLGSLREQLCYPQPVDRFSDEQLRHVLEQVRLAELVLRYPDLSITQDWPRLLSLGEQQRLAFARLLLAAPRFVVLDEATSALDVPTERLLYALLAERDTALVSVGHRPTLLGFHDTVLELDGYGGWRLIPAAGYEFGRSAPAA